MEQDTRTVVGLDVHKASIQVAVFKCGVDRPQAYAIENETKAIERMAARASAGGPAAFVYEAGPCGYEVHRRLTAAGHVCAVIAPGLIPVRPGDRVKTDRRDAEKLARLYRAGELTEIRVPTCEEEAARDLIRAREDALADRLRAKNRLSKFLLRQGRIYGETKAWGVRHRQWLRTQRFEWPAQEETFRTYLQSLEEIEERIRVLDQRITDLAESPRHRDLVRDLRCLRGIDTLSAITVAVEAQDLRRFPNASALMSFTGMVPREASSGERIRRGGITKTGNAHLRRVLVESAWSYRRVTGSSPQLAERRRGRPAEIVRIARRAEDRLRRKFFRLVGRGKPPQVAVVAVARELTGFIWAIGQVSAAA